MRWKILCEAAVIVLSLASVAHADVFAFNLKKTDDKWTCTSVPVDQRPGNVQVSAKLDPTPAADAVALKATISQDGAADVQADLSRSTVAGAQNIWTVTSTVAKASKVSVGGTVETVTVTCEPAAGGKGGDGGKPSGGAGDPSGSTITADDMDAASWLGTDEAQSQLNAIRRVVEQANPKLSSSDIKLLPHLPSGAKAPSYPSSISERHIAQIVMVRAIEDTSSVGFSMITCESVVDFRVGPGDFGALQSTKQPKFRIVAIGSPISCGPDKLRYSLTPNPDSAKAKTATSDLTVRPVYSLTPTAFVGFDATKESTFSVRDGKIAETVDYVGPGLLVGGTYFINGIDLADVRWYQHVFNPFLAISPAAPKDHFVIGTSLTNRGGLFLTIGMGVNHVSKLAEGYSKGQAFSGPGDIPLDKEWKVNLYVGFAVDSNLFASMKKIGGGGNGGGSANAEDAGKKPDAATKGK